MIFWIIFYYSFNINIINYNIKCIMIFWIIFYYWFNIYIKNYNIKCIIKKESYLLYYILMWEKLYSFLLIHRDTIIYNKIIKNYNNENISYYYIINIYN